MKNILVFTTALILLETITIGCRTTSSDKTAGSSIKDAGGSASNATGLQAMAPTDAVRKLLATGAGEGVYNGTLADGGECRLVTEGGPTSDRYSRFRASIFQRSGATQGNLIVKGELDGQSHIQFERILQDQAGGTGNSRILQRIVVNNADGNFTIEECIYPGLGDFDFIIVKDGARVVCSKRLGPLHGWPACGVTVASDMIAIPVPSRGMSCNAQGGWTAEIHPADESGYVDVKLKRPDGTIASDNSHRARFLGHDESAGVSSYELGSWLEMDQTAILKISENIGKMALTLNFDAGFPRKFANCDVLD